MNVIYLIHGVAAVGAGISCWLLFKYHEAHYDLNPRLTLVLSSFTVIFSFLFGILQSQYTNYLTSLEILLIGPLIFLCAIDIKHLELPDKANLVVGMLGILYLLLTPTPFLIGVSCALILFVSFFFVAFVTGGALGGGDIKYVLAFGLFMTPSLILPFLIVATLSGSIYGILILILLKKNAPLPFGPFLILSSIYLLFLF